MASNFFLSHGHSGCVLGALGARSTQSISKLTEATTRIAGGHFDVKLPTTRRDELGHLSASINSMAERLSEMHMGKTLFGRCCP